MKRVEYIIDKYRKIYDLDKIIINVEEKSLNFLPYCDGKTFLINDKKLITYCSTKSKNINSYLNEIEDKYKVKVINYYPICFTKNDGIIISCKIIHESKLLINNSNGDYHSVVNRLNKYSEYYNKDTEKEYFITEKYHRRYNIYRNIIKKYWLTDKRRKKKEFLNLLKEIFGKYNSIIDVSCGDNEDVFKISKKASMVVGNDINMSEISLLCDKYPDYVFTNHNIINMPFKNKVFDIAYCKNTFHHLNGEKEIIAAINSMCTIARKVVIIDIEDPSKVSLKSKLLNKYLYVKYLKDNSKEFLDYDTFKNIIKNNVRNRNVKFKRFSNVLGRYMIAIIEER